MNKPDALRAHLVAAMPELATDPDRLAIYVDKGRLVSRRTPGLGFEYRYQLRIWLGQFTGGPDRVMVPLLLWLRTQQPDLFLRFDREDEAVTFSADILDETSWDVLIGFELTEAVAIEARGDGSGWDVTHLPEPNPDDLLLDGALPDVPLRELWSGDGRLLPGPPLP